MADIPPVSSSAMSALQGGFSLLDRGAAEVVSATQSPLPDGNSGDLVEVRTGSPMEGEPMLSGVRDMMMARVQIGAGAALLHAYSDNRQTLYDMLKP